jgi:hypothetical protein
MSIGDIKALEGDEDDAAPADAASPADVPAVDASTDKKTAPLIHPAKLIDLQRDLPVQLPKQPEVSHTIVGLLKESNLKANKITAMVFFEIPVIASCFCHYL